MAAPRPRIRVVVVDDEPLAVNGLVTLLRADDELDVVGACTDGESAVATIRDARPDLLFLDVQMPEVDGFEVLRRVGASEAPAVVFVTAFDRFAVRAFEVNALDYLLKPYDDERLAAAVARAKQALRTRRADDVVARLDRLLASPVSQLVVREEGRVRVVALRDVDWIEGADYYVRLHVGGKALLMRESMASLSARLDPARFYRVHRSAIVNLARVREIRAIDRGDSAVVLADGTRLRVGRGRRSELEALLERAADAG